MTNRSPLNLSLVSASALFALVSLASFDAKALILNTGSVEASDVSGLVPPPDTGNPTLDGSLRIGDSAPGQTDVTGGSTLQVNEFAAPVGGPDGPFSGARIHVGNGGAGTLNVSGGSTVNVESLTSPDGAVLNVSNIPGNSTGGPSAAGLLQVNNSTVNITGANTAFFNVGRDGSGTAVFENGAALNIQSTGVGVNAGLNVGGFTHGGTPTSSLTLDGPTTNIQVDTLENGLIFVGDQAQGTMTVRNGASVSMNGVRDNILQVGDNAGGNGHLQIQSGGTFTGRLGLIGDDAGTVGAVTIDGANSSLNFVGRDTVDNSRASITVGDDGVGTVDITNGGTLRVNGATVPGRASVVNIGGGLFSADGVGDGTVNVDGAGSQLLHESDGLAFVRVGNKGVGRLNVTNGGDVIVSDLDKLARFEVGLGVDADGTVTVDGAGSSVSAGVDTRIGVAGDGTLNIRNGGAFDSARMFMGSNLGSTGQVSVDGAGSTLDLLGTDEFGNGPVAIVGLGGTATMDVTDGATVNIDTNGEIVTGTLNGGFLVGGTSSAPTGNGTLNVDGAGSTLNVKNATASMQVGRNGTGVLNITDGGKVTNAPGDALAIVGRTSVSTGTVNVTGTGSEWQAGSHLFAGTEVDFTTRETIAGVGGTGSITVGAGGALSTEKIRFGDAQLNVNAGGTVAGEHAMFGVDNGTTATVNVSGAGARLGLTGKDAVSGTRAGLIVGNEGTGTLNINSGGKVDVNGASESGRASVINLGGSLNATTTTGNGTVNVDGSGSELRLSSGEFVLFQVGRNGQGELNVTNGGSVVVEDPNKEGQFRVGRLSTATGTVNIDGAGSSVDAGRSARIGISGQGTLNITNGGTFQSTEFASASGTGGTGNVTISGSGSTLNLLGVDGQGDGAVALVGINGQSIVNVNSGGTMNIDASSETITGLSGGLLIGGSTSSTDQGNGTVNVDGAGSTVNVIHSRASTQVGRRGTGVLNITNGGRVTNAAGDALAVVGRSATATGSVNITGAGSEWQAGSDLFIGTDVDFGSRTAIGNGGEGTVNVANGGRLVADRIVNAGRGTISGGGGTIVGDISNAGGTIAAGNSPGLMNVLGNVDLLGGGMVEIELGGTVFDSGIPQFDYDRIDVSDDIATTGETEGIVTIDTGALFDIDFFGAFTAGLGDTFDVIVADDIDVADLSSLIFDFSDAGLMSGLLWDVDIVAFGQGREALQLSVIGEQVAVSEPGAILILLGGIGVLAAVRRRRRIA